MQPLATENENALEQLDQLSLVIRYVGVRHKIEGNPEGGFNRGGVDPGVWTTHKIFTHTYKRASKHSIKEELWQFQINNSISQCAGIRKTSQHGKIGYKCIGFRLASFFNAVSGMLSAETMTQRKKHALIQKTKICNHGTACCLYANALARNLSIP